MSGEREVAPITKHQKPYTHQTERGTFSGVKIYDDVVYLSHRGEILVIRQSWLVSGGKMTPYGMVCGWKASSSYKNARGERALKVIPLKVEERTEPLIALVQRFLMGNIHFL